MGRLPGELFGCLLGAAYKFGHAGADNSNFSHSHGTLLSVAQDGYSPAGGRNPPPGLH